MAQPDRRPSPAGESRPAPGGRPTRAAPGWVPAAGVPSVAVLVELVRGPFAGGHMKCWERLAEAAAGLGTGTLGMDLTVYVLGERARVDPLSPSVRFVTLPPLAGTRPLLWLTGATDVTDLAPYHPALGRLLPQHDVWHLTHTFAFAATALRLARRRPDGCRRGMVASVHTDVPTLTADYVRGLTARMHLPRSGAGRTRLPEALAAGLTRRVRDRVLRACDQVLVATEAEREEIGALVGGARVAVLGRGMDRTRFRPDPAARTELARTHGVPTDRTLVLFAGRVDCTKRALVVGEAVRRLREAERSVHLVVAGDGPDTGPLATLLGGDVTLLGTLPQEQMARVYPACDVFAFPSRSETAGNVVAEAMACHLPVVLPAGSRTTNWLTAPGQDGVVVEQDDGPGWAAALMPLVDRPGLRHALGAGAGTTARQRIRSWPRVLTDDLLPVWQRAVPAEESR